MTRQVLKAIFSKFDGVKERKSLLYTLSEVIEENPAISEASGEYTLTMILEPIEKETSSKGTPT